jgi:hypothetical protein
MNHDASHGRFEMTDGIGQDLIDAQYAIEYAVLKTKRFGVEIPEPKETEHVARTESYNKWFRWWNNYFKRTLTNEQWLDFECLYNTGKDISHYRPEGSWEN